MDERWTIRRVAADAREMIEEVHGLTGISYGRLVTQAIRVWFDHLEQDEQLTLMQRRLSSLF